MQINIFEGARRITKLIAVLWAIGWVYDLATWNIGTSGSWPANWQDKVFLNSFWAFGGLIFIFLFCWCIGWIVRGFAGIPSGQDKKPYNF